jgi:hypothetical protein
VQVFLEYTKRYADIMNMFPSNGRNARLDLFAEPPPVSDELSLSVLRYLNLCSEEFYLCKEKYLSSRVWRIWEAELKRTLGSPLVVREWARLRKQFQTYPEFWEYVEEIQGRPVASRDIVTTSQPNGDICEREGTAGPANAAMKA